MESKWYYFKEDDGIHRFMIADDDDPLNPRKDWDGNIGTLNLWWNRYMLGDNEGKGEPDEVLNEIIRENVPSEKYDDEKLECDWLKNYKIVLLQEQPNIVLLPCFIYEHGGLAISCSNGSYPFNDRWDSGMAGFIYTTKEKCAEQWGKQAVDDDWKRRAREELVDEVKYYDMYLKNECYGFKEEVYNAEDDDWDDVESVWGFLTDKYGSELVEFFRSEITNEPLIEEEQALEMVKEIRKEHEVMEQAEYTVAI